VALALPPAAWFLAIVRQKVAVLVGRPKVWPAFSNRERLISLRRQINLGLREGGGAATAAGSGLCGTLGSFARQYFPY
jgi:hypothetical protein